MNYVQDSLNNVLLIGFNRSDLIEKSIERLISINSVKLWIAIDGPRLNNKSDFAENQNIRRICKKFDIPKNRIRFSKYNQGCRIGVNNAISWFFDNVESGLILEDDVELDKEYLFQIFRWLDFYSDSDHIASISSHSSIEYFQKRKKTYSYSSSLMPTCRVWGWATWRNNWQEHIKLMKKFSKYSLIRLLLSTPRRFQEFNAILRIWKCINKQFDTWDYEWNYYHIINNKKSITPNGFYCLNHGYRKDATHTFSTSIAPWTKMDKFKDLNYKNKDLLNSPNKSLENMILNECGFPQNSNILKEIIKLIKYEIKEFLLNLTIKIKNKNLFI